MCGFTGFYAPKSNKPREALAAAGEAMSGTLAHRGPDDGGIWQDPDTPLVLAHRRLSIIDLSPLGHQPMESRSGRFVLAYNGEIYNHLDLRRDLEREGVVFRGRSDTETLLAAFEAWGVNRTLPKINGMYAIGLWDRAEKRLHLIRDRLGKKPLYVGLNNGALLFASELKAMRAYPGFEARIDRDVLALYMRLGYITAPHCIYEGVWSLPAGFRLTLDLSKTLPDTLDGLMEPYWNPLRVMEEARQKSVPMSDAQAVDALEDLLGQCVRDRFISDVPLGAFLSGGIDSSAVVAMMQTQSSRPVQTYTIGFHESGFDEAAHAAKVAAHLGTDHHEMYVGAREALDVVPQLPDIYDEPFADISAIPTVLVSRFARHDVTVALSGDGGDEMFGGYSRHLSAPAIYRRMKVFPLAVRRALAASIMKIPVAVWDKIAPARPQFGAGMHKTAAMLSLNNEDDIYMSLLSQWPVSPVLRAAPPRMMAFAPEWTPHGLSFAETMMYRDALSYLPNDVLAKVDRATMSASLEARAPLLDHRMYEFAWGLQENLKIRNGQGKWILRQVLARHVPLSLFERPKQGFSSPIGEWLRGPLREWADNLLSESALRRDGYFNPAMVRAVWAAHLNGQGNHAGKLWNVLMFQSWHDRWMSETGDLQKRNAA